MPLSPLTVGILGLGQIGGSMASRLSAHDAPPTLLGFDLRTELCTAARDRAIVSDVARSETELIESSEVVILALPVRDIVSLLRRQHALLRSKAAVTDTGSVKTEIMRVASDLSLDNFVGGHPLAGAEKSGIASWNHALFNGAPYFITPLSGQDTGAITILNDIVIRLGAKPVPVDPQHHDFIFSVTSGLPHLFAFCLRRQYLNIPESAVDKELFRCPSFRSATRVADSDPETVFQMLWLNRASLSENLGVLLNCLAGAQRALDAGDERGFRRFFKNS